MDEIIQTRVILEKSSLLILKHYDIRYAGLEFKVHETRGAIF